uniref:Zinc finger BED domain-containing protein 4 n=1 Tax=Zeugodacus cucurbitae TaxID=28588 RepID=A0A0A1WM76_ZEUCU
MAPTKKTFNALIYYEENDNNRMKCKTCSRVLKKDRVFNLKKHLLLHGIRPVQKENNSDSKKNMKHSKKNMKHQQIKVQISKKNLVRSYIGLVTEDGFPFDVLDSNNMRNIIDPICQGLKDKSGKNFILNGSKCKAVLEQVAANIKLEIHEECKNRLISLKIDSATGLDPNIFGISAQFISKNEIKSRILGMVELKGAGSSAFENLAKEIVSVLDKYEIALSQIVTITSDNGANMISQIHTGDDDTGKACILQNIEYTKQIDLFDTTENICVGEIQICQCAAQIAQLCALDVTKNTVIREYLFQCRNLTKYILEPSNGYRDLFELRNFTLPQLDCPTRWGSTYNMIDQLNKAKSILSLIETVENNSQDEHIVVNKLLWDFMDSYVTIMAPLQKTIMQFQQEQLHYGNFYALWLVCKLSTNQIVTTSNSSKDSIIYTIGEMLIASMEARTKQLGSNVGFDASLYLDPRFQHILDGSQKQRAINFLKTLWTQIKIHSPIQNLSLTNSNTSHTEHKESNLDLLDDFLSVGVVKNESTDVHEKIEMLKLPYMKSSTNDLNFWKERKSSDPELYALSKICFAIPTTQVTIEPAFSFLKLVLSDNRNRLSHHTLENILLVRLNSAHLDSAIENLNLFVDED